VKPTTTEDVLELLDASYPSAALGAAMELGLFWLLDGHPMDEAGVGEALGIPVNRCRHWLGLLASAGLLERVADGYASSSTARTAILDAHRQDTWALLAEEAREHLPELVDLAVHITHPGSVLEVLGLERPSYVSKMREDPVRARRFTRMLYDLHRPLADDLAEYLDMDGVRRFMDLGGGSGVVSLAVLDRHPGTTAVVVDVATVCEAGREIAAEAGLQDRVTYHPADFLEDDLPSDFDLVLECDVNVYDESLLRKVRTSLSPGGRFVIVDEFAPAEGAAPSSRVDWAFDRTLSDPDASYVTASEVRRLLEATGFRDPSEEALPSASEGAGRFGSDLTVLTARA
jgi:SAM-dependent methyltransferase